MTTICFREGILAADTRAYSGDSSPIGFKQKIFRGQDGTLFGISTPQPGLSEEVAAWMMADEDVKPDLVPALHGDIGFQALEITPEGDVFYYNNRFVPSGPLYGPWHAIGSGCDYAIGALRMGATATEAVEVAMEFDPWTGGDVTLLRLGGDEELEKAE